MKTWLLRSLYAGIGAALLGTLTVVLGIVPVAASSGHFDVTSWFLHFAMQRSVATHSLGTEVPALDDPRLVLIGAGHYESGCRFCHGAPGGGVPAVPLAMTPPPPELDAHLERYEDRELYYIVRHGVKFTAMPAWPARERPEEVWAVVAFLRAMQGMGGEDYRALVWASTREDALEAGAPEVVRQHCVRCHGVEGEGRGLDAFPRIDGQRLGYMTRTLEAYARGARHSGIMEPIAKSLGREALHEAAAWYASRPRAARDVRSPRSEPTDGEEHLPLCDACHGPSERALHPAFPLLAGQSRSYLETQLTLFREKRRGGSNYHGLMQTVSHWLSPAQMTSLSAYYAELPALSAVEP